MILTAKTIVTGDGETVLRGHAVRIDATGKIAEVSPRQALAAAHPEEQILDFGDATILPGLIDMHIHLGSYIHYPDALRFNDHLIAYKALYAAQSALTVGVTTVRDMSSDHLLCEKLRYAGQKGYVTIPRIFHCDRGLTMTGGHGDQITNLKNECEVADGVDEIRKVIRKQLRAGADWIKLMSSHRVMTRPEYTQEELNAAVEETHRLERKCAIHAGVGPSVGMAIEAGFDTIEHATYLTLEQAAEMKRKGRAWIPTIITYTDAYDRYKDADGSPGPDAPLPVRSFWSFFKSAAESYKTNFKAIYDLGVTIAAGTDMVLFGAPPAPVAKELAFMVDYGITPVQAIRLGTHNGAKLLDIENSVGLVKAGLNADLLVCDGDASADIRSLQRVRRVLMSGKTVYRPEAPEC